MDELDRLLKENPEIRPHVVSVLRIVAKEADKWTRRFDDARRIPDMIRETANHIET